MDVVKGVEYEPGGAPGVTLGRSVVTRVLHEVRVGWDGCPGEFVCWWQVLG